jgi:hypothetical protein
MNDLGTAYDELYVYTMGRPGFILQHVVDAFSVQTATKDNKPIGVIFGLVGLYLYVEKQFFGRQVQEVHRKLGEKKRDWPKINFPEDRGTLTVIDVMATCEGEERDKAIRAWCGSVWHAFGANRQMIIDLLKQYDIA